MGLRPDSLEMFRAHGPDFYDFYKAQVNRDKNGSRRALLFCFIFVVSLQAHAKFFLSR